MSPTNFSEPMSSDKVLEGFIYESTQALDKTIEFFPITVTILEKINVKYAKNGDFGLSPSWVIYLQALSILLLGFIRENNTGSDEL